MHFRDPKTHTDRALENASSQEPLRTGIVHPVTGYAIEAIKEAVDAGLIIPTLIGPKSKMREAGEAAGIDIGHWKMIDTAHSHASAEAGAELAASGKVEALMKGSLHSDEILGAVIHHPGLKTERRISHVFAMDVKTYHKTVLVTDAAINVAPDLKTKVDIIQNALNLFSATHDEEEIPKIALLSAVETVNPKMQSTIDAACLCKMADRGQIPGNFLIDGPLAFDNAISKEAAKQKGIKSLVAGDPDIMVAPDLVSGNIMYKEMVYVAEAEAAGIVLGARVPLILTSRADSLRARLLSCALAVNFAVARREGRIK